ncbi:cysteine-rich secretory protein family protein [Ruminiclostridium hungatei]|uniref:Cysteine-rich secretory protein family protein n=1 Tax=Ruminiclostridium hungatei TaxID=48256 RepID=A0A1V4SLJ6_RUMHU|nr:CAP domain-containing protein [Ruminiclostridium hungatei]OPX44101.1 cysteine-rich secretory protein family protein [Ruminiclostridium hungatei]
MNNKKTTLISTLAASAIIVSIFAFNSNAVEWGSKTAYAPGVTATATASDTAAAKNSTVQKTVSNTVAEAAANPTAVEEVKAAAADAVPQIKSICSTGAKPSIKVSSGKNSTNATTVTSVTNQQPNANSIKTGLDQILKAYAGGLTKKVQNSNCNSTSNKASTTAAKPSAKPAATKPAGSTQPTPAANGDYSAFQKKVVELVNKERAKAGLKALKINSELGKVATLKSQDMAKNNYFDHNSPTYGSPFDMMKRFGITYRTAGENIAMGQTSPEQVMNGWMNSPGHRANILKASFTQIGVGVAKNSAGRLYWTQQFIG